MHIESEIPFQPDRYRGVKRLFLTFFLAVLILLLASAFLVNLILPPLISQRVEEMLARDWYTPLDTAKRQDWNSVMILPKGHFMDERPAYKQLKMHLHTGVDIQNRYAGGPGEPVYPAANGKVHDVRVQDTGTRVTLFHFLPDGEIIYTSYIHMADVKVKPGMRVTPETAIARRFNEEELKKYGSYYNHLHFQVHKKVFTPSDTVQLTSKEQVMERFYDPTYIFYHHKSNIVPQWRKWVKEKKIGFWELVRITLL